MQITSYMYSSFSISNPTFVPRDEFEEYNPPST